MNIDGYYLGSEYVDLYVGDTSPTHIDWTRIYNSRSAIPDNEKKSFYLDLGCGNGLSTVIHAINNPNIQFLGIDFFSKHIDNANNYKKSLGLGNIEFKEISFKNFYEEFSYTKFDYIIAHGILTWISNDNLSYVLKIANNNLSENGVFYNCYNTPHGWGQLLGLQRLASYLANKSDGKKVIDYIRATYIEFTERNKLFINDNPLLYKRLLEWEKSDYRYLTQEFCNKNWNLLTFNEACEIHATHNLKFCASTKPLENYDSFSITNGLEFKEIQENEILKIELADALKNTSLRKDLWIKANTSTKSNVSKVSYSKFSAGCYKSKINYPIKIAIDSIEYQSNDPMYQSLLDYISQKIIVGYDEVSQKFNILDKEIHKYLTVLKFSGYIYIIDNTTLNDATESNIKLINCQINRGIRNSIWIATPKNGDALKLNIIQALFLKYYVECRNNNEKLISLTLDDINNFGILVNNETPSHKTLMGIFEEFHNKGIPKIMKLGGICS